MPTWITAVESLVETVLGASGGEHGAHGEVQPWVLVSVLVNFIVFVGILARAIRPALTRALGSRRTNMERTMIEAQKKQKDAETRLRELQFKLDHLEEEVQRIMRSYEAEAEAERQRLTHDADRAAERMARETESTIEQEKRKAEKSIEVATLDATMSIAEAILRERITLADQRRLADQYIADLSRRGPPS